MGNRLFWRLIINHCSIFGQNSRLIRWALVLQQYQVTVKAIK